MSNNTQQVVGTSTQQVVTSLVSNGVIFGVFVTTFLLLRVSIKRIYQPKSSFPLVEEEKRPDPLPNGLFSWLLPLLKKSDNFVLQQAGLDGYFFLRYLFIIFAYCLVSMLYVLPILLPVNAVHGVGQSGLNILAYQNVSDSNRYYAHIFVSWVFFGSFLFIVYRELYYYNSMRQNVIASNRYATKLSSRTVLFQNVPQQYLSEDEFAKLFEGVKRIWIARSKNGLESAVKNRDKLAIQFENSLVKFQKTLVKKIAKIRKNDDSVMNTGNYKEYVNVEKELPKKRITTWKKLHTHKVDLFQYVKDELPRQNETITVLQQNQLDSTPFNSVFVEFESQYQAQLASQIVTYHAPLYMSPAYVGIEPNDIVWFNLRMLPYERLARKAMAVIAIIALVILWAFPVAFVGLISNITYLTDKVHFLKFIYKLPDQLLGLLTSLAPTVALAVLMSFLPIIIRGLAKIAGLPSYQTIEYFTQQSYFAFQVIQVFLVTTITSAATSAVTQIVANPTSAMELLAQNLPKASNFYIAYIVLQGMSVASGSLLQIQPLAIYYVLGKFLDNTPRKKYTRFTNLSSMDWGTTYPVYTNLAVIIFSYAIISPIILLFGCVGFFLLWLAYLYNLVYVFKEAPDSRGIHYPRALFQTMVGLYIGQICLLGLFVFGKGWGPIVLQAVSLVVTTFIHLFLNKNFDLLNRSVPVDIMKPSDGVSSTASYRNIYKNMDEERRKKYGDDIKELSQYPIRKYVSHSRSNSVTTSVSPTNGQTRNSRSKFNFTYEVTNTMTYSNNDNVPIKTGFIPSLADGGYDNSSLRTSDPFYIKFFKPHVHASYAAIKTRIPEIYHGTDPSEFVDKKKVAHSYDYPAVTAECPVLWIPKDPYGFSQKLIDEFADVITISHHNAFMDEKGNITWENEPPNSSSSTDFDDDFDKDDVISFENYRTYNSKLQDEDEDFNVDEPYEIKRMVIEETGNSPR